MNVCARRACFINMYAADATAVTFGLQMSITKTSAGPILRINMLRLHARPQFFFDLCSGREPPLPPAVAAGRAVNGGIIISGWMETCNSGIKLHGLVTKTFSGVTVPSFRFGVFR